MKVTDSSKLLPDMQKLVNFLYFGGLKLILQVAWIFIDIDY